MWIFFSKHSYGTRAIFLLCKQILFMRRLYIVKILIYILDLYLQVGKRRKATIPSYPHIHAVRYGYTVHGTAEEHMSFIARKGLLGFSVKSNFQSACPVPNEDRVSSSLAEIFHWPTANVSEQHRFWRCALAQARQNLCCLHMLLQPFSHGVAQITVTRKATISDATFFGKWDIMLCFCKEHFLDIHDFCCYRKHLEEADKNVPEVEILFFFFFFFFFFVQ